jgi:hypothetical protein
MHLKDIINSKGEKTIRAGQESMGMCDLTCSYHPIPGMMRRSKNQVTPYFTNL